MLQVSIADRTRQIKQLNDATQKVREDLSKAQEVRSAEHAANTEQIADSTGAIEAVAEAIAILEEFYKKAGQSTAFTQDEPEIPRIFEDPYKGMQNESGGVVGMLQANSSDLFRLKVETTASEAKAVEEFKSFKTDTEAVLMQFKSELKNAEQSCAEAKEALASAEALNTETDSTFDTENFDLTENIDDLRVAIAQLEKDVA